MRTGPLRRILLVEDDPDIQLVAKLALATIGGFDVRVCDGGREALEAAPAFDPDLIVLDVMMPEMDGPTTFRAFRDLPATAATPVVFLTAKAQVNERAQFLELGAIAVIAKPFDPLQLAAEVSQIWDRHRSTLA